MADSADNDALFTPRPAGAHADGHPTVPADESIASAEGRPLPSERFVGGDPLRAVAAVSVLVYHTAYGAVGASQVPLVRTDGTTSFGDGAFGPASALFENLHLGLYVFFVLSGYLLARPFVRAFVARDRHPHVGGYLVNRVLRIVPAFWAAIALSLVIRGAGGSSPLDVLSVFLFAQNYNPSPAGDIIGHAWTLDVEMAFYVLLPVAAGLVAWTARDLVDRHARILLLLGLAATVYAASVGLRAAGPDTFMFQRSLPAMLFAFVPGIVLATIEIVAPRTLKRRGDGRRLAWAALILGTGALIAHTRLGLGVNGGRALLASAGTGLLVAAPLILQWSGLRVWGVLDNRVMRWLGERSYSFYLFHLLVGFEVGDRLVEPGMGSWEAFGIALVPHFAITTVVAAISFRVVEVPFLRLRTAWRGRIEHSRPRPGFGLAARGAAEKT